MNIEQKIGKPAIYKIVNNENGKLYVGSCVGHYLRKGQHWHKLRKGTHDNNHLQSAWNLYGEKKFTFEIIEFVNIEFLIEREQYWIDTLQGCDRTIGYNKAPRAGSNLGRKMSKESKLKMSFAKKGVKQSLDFVKRRTEANYKRVECYTKDGSFVNAFNSVKEASNYFGINSTSISKCLSNTYPNNKTAAGHIWKYVK
jgi:hypothetical protein